jgi:NO-binding membrane sensor protein with MHYT domain
MVDNIVRGFMEEAKMLRQLEKHWNGGLIAASIAISLLGAFTSTQLMCQARTSRYFSGALVWAILASLAFGFCSIWSLHEVATLACELDLPIGIDVPLTILSALLAVVFTFAALASDLLLDRYHHAQKTKHLMRKKKRIRSASANVLSSTVGDGDISEPLLDPFGQIHEEDNECRPDLELEPRSDSGLSQTFPLEADENAALNIEIRSESHSKAQPGLNVDPARSSLYLSINNKSSTETSVRGLEHTLELQIEQSNDTNSESCFTESLQRTSSERSISRRSSSVVGSSSSKFGLSNIMSIATNRKSSSSAKNAFLLIYTGFTRRNVIKGLFWSLAITGMHYVGILALHVPTGYLRFNPILVALSGVISWIVCLAGCILMPRMEVHLLKQFLFSVVATSGVAAMHFTGISVSLPDFRTADAYEQGCERQRFGLMSHHLNPEVIHRPLPLLLPALPLLPALQRMLC